MKRLVTVIVAGAILVTPLASFALRTISPAEGETTFVEISQKDLNVIKTSLPGVKALSASTSLDIKVEGRNVFVKYTGTEPVAEPQELILTSEDGDVYPLVLKPMGIPAETVVLRGEENKERIAWEKSHDYITAVKEIVKGLYLGRRPRGYMEEDLNEDRTEWKEVARTLKKRYTGAALVGEMFTLKAQSREVVLDEREFYAPGVLAVSIDTHSLAAGEKTDLVVVKKR